MSATAVSSDKDLTDAEVRDLFELCASHATDHLGHACGYAGKGCRLEGGRCRLRTLNLAECDGLLDEWLRRHGRPA